ncbi:MAG: hypothetical protein AB2L07_07980 [Thermoanaerobaculaceae bacterium]
MATSASVYGPAGERFWVSGSGHPGAAAEQRAADNLSAAHPYHTVKT